MARRRDLEGGSTVTSGVVSALGRTMEQEGLPMLHNLQHFQEALARHRIGETVEVSLWRDGETLARSAVLAEYQ